MRNVHRSTTKAACALTLLWGTAGHATPVIEDAQDAAQTALLAEIASVLTVDVVGQAKEAFEVAQETASLLRKATEVIVDFQYLATNPETIFDDAQAGFGMSFPELEAIANDVEAARANLAGERAGDPRSLFDLMSHARQTKQGVYQTLMAFDNAVDGHLTTYLEQYKQNAKFKEMTQDIVQEASRDHSPNEAIVISARANALSAQANRETADAALEQTRVAQQQYVNQRKRELAEEVAKEEHAKALEDSMPADETIDGLESAREMANPRTPSRQRVGTGLQ